LPDRCSRIYNIYERPAEELIKYFHPTANQKLNDSRAFCQLAIIDIQFGFQSKYTFTQIADTHHYLGSSVTGLFLKQLNIVGEL
jgi:hypothetical protein